MYGAVGILIILALSVSLYAESEINLEAVLASIVIAVDERRELEDAVVTGATGGKIQTARVRILERREWRELRTVVPIISRAEAAPVKKSDELEESLKACLETPKVKESTVPLTMGLEMAIAPTPEQVKKYRKELTDCLKQSLPEALTVGAIDFQIKTRDEGWHERVQAPAKGVTVSHSGARGNAKFERRATAAGLTTKARKH
ncbi:MAG TPA: hypothetical protein VMY18_09725 [Acidobacteriota bacterium]|nr:hypothetical protein [Acidobacteriota bacterium]